MSSSKPRVLLTIRHFPPDGGGAEVAALRMSKALVRSGYPMEVLTGRYGRRASVESIKGVRVRRHFVGPYIKGIHEMFYLSTLAWRLIAHRHDYDIIHTFQLNLSAVVSVVMGRFLGKPVVVSARGAGNTGDIDLWKRIPFGSLLLRFVACHVKACAGVSRQVVQELNRAGFDPQQTWYLPNGVSYPKRRLPSKSVLRKTFRLPENAVIGIYVGRLSPEKAPDLLVEAWAHVCGKYAKCHLLVVGDGKMETVLKRAVSREGIDRNVSFAGRVNDVWHYLKCADFFLLPSLQEGMPMALLEAMAAGLPGIASDIPGIREIVQNKKNGLLFKPGDRAMLTACILTLATSGRLREKMGKAAKDTVESGFKLEDVCGRYVDFYGAVMQS